MEILKNPKNYLTNLPDEVIIYNVRYGPNSTLILAVPLSILGYGTWSVFSYAVTPVIFLAVLAWYRVFFRTIHFIINDRGVVIQSILGLYTFPVPWSEITSFHFTVKTSFLGMQTELPVNTIVFKRIANKRTLTVPLFGIENQFDEIRRKVVKLAAAQKIRGGEVVQL